MKKKTYLTPELVLVEMDLRNVIATSGSFGHIDPGAEGDPWASKDRRNIIWDE